MNSSEIKLSVCIVTYNQEKYIGECLESLVTQDTDFLFEIIIGDDASSDHTSEIILRYYEKYPHLIIPILRKKNLGPVRNIIDIYKKAKGQYIAHLDGDDLALPGKLQKQVEILDANTDCSICSHNMWFWNGELTKNDFSKRNTGKYSLLDLYHELPFFAHSSKMFRNDLLESYWGELSNVALDATIHIEQAKRGDIYYLQDHYGIYRQGVGISEQGQRLNPIVIQEIIRLYEKAIIDEIGDTLSLKHAFAQSCFRFAHTSFYFGQPDDFKKYIRKSYEVMHISQKQKIMYYLSYIPRIAIGGIKAVLFLKKKLINE